jgi:hypothetical protein
MIVHTPPVCGVSENGLNIFLNAPDCLTVRLHENL